MLCSSSAFFCQSRLFQWQSSLTHIYLKWGPLPGWVGVQGSWRAFASRMVEDGLIIFSLIEPIWWIILVKHISVCSFSRWLTLSSHLLIEKQLGIQESYCFCLCSWKFNFLFVWEYFFVFNSLSTKDENSRIFKPHRSWSGGSKWPCQAHLGLDYLPSSLWILTML